MYKNSCGFVCEDFPKENQNIKSMTYDKKLSFGQNGGESGVGAALYRKYFSIPIE